MGRFPSIFLVLAGAVFASTTTWPFTAAFQPKPNPIPKSSTAKAAGTAKPTKSSLPVAAPMPTANEVEGKAAATKPTITLKKKRIVASHNKAKVNNEGRRKDGQSRKVSSVAAPTTLANQTKINITNNKQPQQPSSYNKNNDKTKQRNEKQEFAWLYWLYRQWQERPVGKVDASILQQFLPAASCWKAKQSRLGAQRAWDLVERYSMEYLAGNTAATIDVVSTSLPLPQQQQQQPVYTQSYYSKLCRTGFEAWMQLSSTSDETTTATTLTEERLNSLQAMVDRALKESDANDNASLAGRARILQGHVDEQRQYVQDKLQPRNKMNSKEDVNKNNNIPNPQEISTLLERAFAFTSNTAEVDGRRQLEDSLLAMQQTVQAIERLLPSNPQQHAAHQSSLLLDAIDEYERELIFSLPQQEMMLQHHSQWMSVVVPFWEFLHHSLIRSFVQTNQPERAEKALAFMQDVLHSSHNPAQNELDIERQSLELIVAMDKEGKDLIELIQKDQEYIWLHWLSHELEQSSSASNVGNLDPSTLNLVIPALSMHAKRKTRNDAEQAEHLLNRYIQEFKAGNPHAAPSNSIFNRVCDAWAKLGDPKRAHEVLNNMVELRQGYPNLKEDLKPDVISLSTLAAAWANSEDPQAAKNAEDILRRMEAEDLNPTTITYNTVLKSLIHSSWVSKAMRAEEIVQRMEQRFAAGHDECKPSIRTYQSLIAAWSRTDLAGTPQKAEQVLHLLDKKVTEDGRVDLEPNAHCFAAAIHAWANSYEKQKAQRAYNILTHMRERFEKQGKEHCKPNVVVYTAVINACANPAKGTEKESAFQLACLTMDELRNNRQYGVPNYLTYATFLRVCSTTLELGPSRDKIVRSVFTTCCQEGQVAPAVIDKLKVAATDGLYQELIVDEGIQKANGSLNLPSSWTRSVQTANQRGSRSRGRPDRKSQPERARLQEVRTLSGTAGQYSKGSA